MYSLRERFDQKTFHGCEKYCGLSGQATNHESSIYAVISLLTTRTITN